MPASPCHYNESKSLSQMARSGHRMSRFWPRMLGIRSRNLRFCHRFAICWQRISRCSYSMMAFWEQLRRLVSLRIHLWPSNNRRKCRGHLPVTTAQAGDQRRKSFLTTAQVGDRRTKLQAGDQQRQVHTSDVYTSSQTAAAPGRQGKSLEQG